jgi:hypothetical protein
VPRPSPPTVFMAHSRDDDEGWTFFDHLFAAAGVRAYWYPFPEGRTYPHWKGILKSITEAASLFVVLSKPMESKPHTRSWVSFEAGIAKGLGRPIWVFEDLREKVDIPVPGATGYLQRPSKATTLKTEVFEGLVTSAGTEPPPFRGGEVWFKGVCRNADCREEFMAYVLDPKTARCPACRKPGPLTAFAPPSGSGETPEPVTFQAGQPTSPSIEALMGELDQIAGEILARQAKPPKTGPTG